MASCGSPSLKIGSLSVDSALEALVPADTIFIMGANLDALRNTAVYQQHIGIVNLPRLNDFTRQTGLDPRKDLSQIISASNGKTGVLLARGKFNTADLETRLERQGAKRVVYKGYKLFGDDTSTVVFINSTTAIAGATPMVRSIVDQRGQPKHGMPPALAERIRAIPKNSQIWAGLIGGFQGLDLPIGKNSALGSVLRVVQGINSATLGIDVSNGFDLNGDAICKADDDARHLHDLLKGVIGLGRLSTPDNHPELLQLYDAIKVDQDRNRVLITAHIPPDLVEKFIDLWVKRR